MGRFSFVPCAAPRPVSSAKPVPGRSVSADRVYEVAWPEEDRGGSRVSREGRGRWLVLADRGGVGLELAGRLEARGEECELLYAGAVPSGSRGRAVRPEEVNEAVRGLWHEMGTPLRGVIHLWGVGESGLSGLGSFAGECVESVLGVAKALVGSGSPGTRLWIVTRGAEAVGGEVSSVIGSGLWGLGRVIALEHPELWGGLLDLDPNDSGILGLWEEIWEPDGEDQVAWRGGTRRVARLSRSGELGDEIRLSGDGSYLITGGVGGLGLRVARWMVGRGARRLYLVSRRGVGEGSREAIQELEVLGARVEVLTGDVSDRERMRFVIEHAGREAPLKGIVHAAGVMEPCAVKDMRPEDVGTVFRPKVDGGVVLHELSEGLALDFFVLFSSAAGVWGSQGAGHYAAANHFLDGLASYRRSKGLPGLSVAWGPWGGGGMANEESQRWLGQMGVGVLDPHEGLEILGRLLGGQKTLATVATVDWNTFRPVYEARAHRPLLKDMNSPLSGAPDAIPVLRRLVEEAPPHARWEVLLAQVRGEVVEVRVHSFPTRRSSDLARSSRSSGSTLPGSPTRGGAFPPWGWTP